MQTGGDWKVKKISLALIILALAMGTLAVGPVQANQILNGSFEAPVLNSVDDPMGFRTIPPGDATGFVWTVVTNNVDAFKNGVLGTTATVYEGVQALDLVGSGSTGAIQQNFATVAGQQYSFFFAYANNPISTTTASADVTITDGLTTLLSQSITHNSSTTSNFDWTTFSQSFIATGTSATLLYNNTAGSTNGGILLDAVDISPSVVPLPPSVFLFGSGLLGLAGFGRRLRQKA